MIDKVFRHSAVRYLLVGLLSYLTDAGSLWLLHGVLSVPLAVATTVAYAASFVVNFGLNRNVVFPDGRDRGRGISRQLVRYVILVVANYLATLAIVLGLADAGLNYLAAKTIAVVVIAIGNYFAYRYWVFAASARATPVPARGEQLERK